MNGAVHLKVEVVDGGLKRRERGVDHRVTLAVVAKELWDAHVGGAGLCSFMTLHRRTGSAVLRRSDGDEVLG